MSEEAEVRDALARFIEGREVARVRLDLVEGPNDWSALFAEILVERGYLPTTVAEAPVEPGERVPAFLIRDGAAIFGWIFWEKFHEGRLRKLWGSVVRNAKGDWAIQVGPRRREILHANLGERVLVDIDFPSSL
ncbi:MAG: hypothetical protein KC466_12325 [Myxococcales bacterium]|nr:hypothetical protein [Myxococcales bacterium]